MSIPEEGDVKPCCISHEFFRTASKNANKIAVVHASGGIRICREWRESTHQGSVGLDEDQLLHSPRVSSSPPVYPGDECFTYSDIMLAVDSLSRRIRRVLDGGDDSDLVMPRDYIPTSETSDGFNGIPRIVGVHIVPSVEYIVAVLSILRCGEAFLPLDPLWPEERIFSIASSSKAGLVVTLASGRCDEADWIAEGSNCPVLCLSVERSLEKSVGQSDLAWPCEAKTLRLFCYLMYTSGSTGKPKGVCGTEKGLLNRFLWMQELFPLRSEDVLLFKISISFIDHLQEFLSAVLTCTPLIIPPFEELKTNSFYLVDVSKVYCVSRLVAVPSLMRSVLPAIQRSNWMKSLKLLVLSGEILSISLWNVLHSVLPETAILNLYGSTEVSGDCTYFDCKNLPKILETEALSSVPIGVPISKCDVVLHSGSHLHDEGEIYVGGACLSMGYFSDLLLGLPVKDIGTTLHFKTGDYARRLQSGDFLFLGRKDRTIKVNGQRVALEEIENVLREHPSVGDAAVSFHRSHEESSQLWAYIVLKRNNEIENEQTPIAEGEHASERLILSIRSWLVRKLPLPMIASHYLCIESLPMSSTGKVDYAMLERSTFISKRPRSEFHNDRCCQDHLQIIKEVFCDALLAEVLDHDDFFMMGGNSISAAQVAHKLGIDMRLLYIFPTPMKLLNALLDMKGSHENIFSLSNVTGKKSKVHDFSMNLEKNDDFSFSRGALNMASSLSQASKSASQVDCYTWLSNFYLPRTCSFSRCNQFLHGRNPELNDLPKACWTMEVPRNRSWNLQEMWKVPLKSCVDASPLVVLKDDNVHLFIGSHSHIFICVDALSGSVRWEVQLEGRIECSAAVTGDFLQVVVGCYRGRIYFLDFMTGNISWTFQTDGEVKMQPVVCRNLVWCGSYDHRLYALDYEKQCCVYQISCGGSIYGSPSIDMVRNMLYVASTSGCVTALSVKALPFSVAWLYESGAPIFGSLSLNSLDGNVICCLVNGQVLALNSNGSVVWKATADGPIFAGACISSALPSQVLICCRNGSVYSFELEGGGLLWEYQVGDPITSSAYVDEHIQLVTKPSHPFHRLACICSSSGSIHILRINSNIIPERNRQEEVSEKPLVQKFAFMDLPGGIFSSPVMIGGRIFIGCRDDSIHCISLFSESYHDGV